MRTGVNIRKRKDGRYEARYPKGRDAQGKLLYGYCYGRTFEEVQAKRDRMLALHPREMNLLILGAGGHGEAIRELAQTLGVFRKIGFLDDDTKNPLAMGPCDDCLRYIEEYPIAIPSVGNRELRMRWIEMLAKYGFVLPVLIHPTATVSPSAEIGYGTVIEARAIVSSGVFIGSGCIISSGATIDRNMKIPNGTYIACGKVISMNY